VSTVLITGATGFIGSRLVARLADRHEVITLARGPAPAGAYRHVRGSFASEHALVQLDGTALDVVVHLAAEVGGCTEEAGLETNVCGTRRMLRHLVDQGCRRFVLASSVAAVGSLTHDFVPREVPIDDDHPCDAIDPYGLSKGLMEEIAFYFHRCDPELDLSVLRIGAVLPPDAAPVDADSIASMPFPFIDLAAISVDDLVVALERAVERELRPGIRRFNVVAPWARTPLPVSETLRLLLGPLIDGLDLSYYEQEGHEQAPLYRIDRLAEELGFVAAVDTRTMTGTAAARGE
jgi:nucleoside-diphosphate-sugar epimerase